MNHRRNKHIRYTRDFHMRTYFQGNLLKCNSFLWKWNKIHQNIDFQIIIYDNEHRLLPSSPVNAQSRSPSAEFFVVLIDFIFLEIKTVWDFMNVNEIETNHISIVEVCIYQIQYIETSMDHMFVIYSVHLRQNHQCNHHYDRCE